MNQVNFLDKKESIFKNLKKGKNKIMNHIFNEYSDEQIKTMYESLNNDTYNFSLKLKVGDKIVGKLVGQTASDYLFDIGYKDYIRVEKRKSENDALSRLADSDNSISLETEIELLITEVSETPYTLKASLSALQKNDTYLDILNNIDEPIEAYIMDILPAGFSLKLNYNGYKIPAFMPNILAGVNKLSSEQTQDLVGKTIDIMIESYSSEKGTFIASRKKYLQSLIPQAIENLNIVDEQGKPIEFTGKITGTAKFGIFVEFNEFLTGMIHKDNLSDKYKNTYQNLESGSDITFYIKEIINDKLVLTQVWKETLWDTVKKDVQYTGIVQDEKSFGLLIRLDDDTLGLVHNSEVEKFGTKPTIGSKVKVKVIAIMKMERKIYLTLVK